MNAHNEASKPAIKNYKTLVFDCDGVLLNSNKVKTQAFYDCALPYGEAAAQSLVDYHVNNGGISRYKKFDYFLRTVLGKSVYDDAELGNLLDTYAHYAKQGLLNCEVAEGLENLRKALPEAQWLVVSGGDQAELREVFEQRKLAHYFNGGIFGSPDNKDDILAREAGHNIRMPAVFIGDSRYDYEAANRAGLDFIFVKEWSEFKEYPLYFHNKEIEMIVSIACLLADSG
jgi:phosphoglycolate phosphatase-like HAD superfamily hydrolase